MLCTFQSLQIVEECEVEVLERDVKHVFKAWVLREVQVTKPPSL